MTFPCDYNALLPFRSTHIRFEDGTEKHIEDEWTSPDNPIRHSTMSWTGRTEIKILEKEPENAPIEVESAPFEPDHEAPGTPVPMTPGAVEAAPATPGGALRRRRPRVRQLQRGFWTQIESVELKNLMERTKEWLDVRGGSDWQILPLSEEIGRDWLVHESANAELQLILISATATRLAFA